MFIEKAYLFHDLKPQFMERIDACLTRESAPQGAFLFRRGEPAEYLYVLQDGRVRLSYDETGEVAFVISNPGDAIGWSAVVEREAYSASAECLSPVMVAKVPSAKLAEIFRDDPESGLIFFKRLARSIGERLVGFYRLIPSAHEEKRPAPGF